MPFKIFSDFESSLSLKVSLLKSKPKAVMISKGKEAYCINHRAMLTSESNKERDSELFEQAFTLLEKEKRVKREKRASGSH